MRYLNALDQDFLKKPAFSLFSVSTQPPIYYTYIYMYM